MIEDTSKPFVTTVYIEGVEYGRGAYSNKKISKHMAAEVALQKLVPSGEYPKTKKEEDEKQRITEFLQVRIDDHLSFFFF